METNQYQFVQQTKWHQHLVQYLVPLTRQSSARLELQLDHSWHFATRHITNSVRYLKLTLICQLHKSEFFVGSWNSPYGSRNFPFGWNRTFITVFTTVGHWTTWTSWIHFMPLHRISLRLISKNFSQRSSVSMRSLPFQIVKPTSMQITFLLARYICSDFIYSGQSSKYWSYNTDYEGPRHVFSLF